MWLLIHSIMTIIIIVIFIIIIKCTKYTILLFLKRKFIGEIFNILK